MLKTIFFIVIATSVHCFQLQDKINEDQVDQSHLPVQQGQRVNSFRPRSDWSYYYPSWSIPSISHFFKDDDYVEESSAISKRLAALEKRVKELNDLLKKQSSGPKKQETATTPVNKVEPAPCKESSNSKPPTQMENKPETMNKPAELEKITPIPDTENMPMKPVENSENEDKLEESAKTEEILSKEPSPAVN